MSRVKPPPTWMRWFWIGGIYGMGIEFIIGRL
jgi:hypothetical protein